MATMFQSNIFFFFLAFLLFFSYSNKGYGREVVVVNHAHQYVIEVQSLLPASTCSVFSSPGTKGASSRLPIYHKIGPCSPFTNKDSTQKALNHTKILLQDQSRVHSIHTKISKRDPSITPGQTKLPANSGESLGTGNFYVTLGFGTPKKDLPILFDTGSDLTWIQCQPCAGGCYAQRDPIFDPSKSPSYSNISCSSPVCSQLTAGTGHAPSCSSSACVYGIQYGDQSYSVGLFGLDKLTVTPSDVFSNFKFGCGQNNDGLFGEAAGLLGLGRDQISFVSQTAAKYNKIFSYCIPTKSSGFLAFGEQSTVAKFTPLLTDSRGPSFYFLDLQGISVGGKKLSVSSATYSLGGTIIDSGTVITRLPPAAYTALRTEFRKAMSSYPTAPGVSILDTCYNFSGLKTVKVPTLALLFAGGTSLDVAKAGVFYAVSESQVCLAFAGNSYEDDVTIIGNTQQRTLEIVYDVGGGKLGFGPGSCT